MKELYDDRMGVTEEGRSVPTNIPSDELLQGPARRKELVARYYKQKVLDDFLARRIFNVPDDVPSEPLEGKGLSINKLAMDPTTADDYSWGGEEGAKNYLQGALSPIIPQIRQAAVAGNDAASGRPRKPPGVI